MTDMTSRSGASEKTVKRTLGWLREQGAKISYVASLHGYKLLSPDFQCPRAEPALEDLQAMLTAAGLLQELGQTKLAQRAHAMVRDIERQFDGAKSRIHPDALRVTQRSDVLRNPQWVLDLLRAVGNEILCITYQSPWNNQANEHRFEPWQVWLHDGVFYVRGYSRLRRQPRTFRVAHIAGLRKTGEKPSEPRPVDLRSAADPSLVGVDEDRPGIAVVRLRGSVARLVRVARWDATQEDRWDDAEQTLERRLPYSSVREFARRLLGYVDGIESVEPEELRSHLLTVMHAATKKLAP